MSVIARIFSRRIITATPQQEESIQPKVKLGKCRIEDLEMGRVLGTGSFGRVYLTHKKGSGEVFATKALSKACIISQKQLEHVKAEKNILQKIDFPFIVNLVGYSQDITHVYLVMEYVCGWAFGVLIYEMLAGYAPFYDTDPMGTYQKILAGKVVFPAHFSRSAKDLIRKLLTSELSKRLGCLKGGVDDIKNHSWFANVNWDNVSMRRESPPIRPKIEGPDDTSNFEDYSNLEPERDDVDILTKEEQDFFRDL